MKGITTTPRCLPVKRAWRSCSTVPSIGLGLQGEWSGFPAIAYHWRWRRWADTDRVCCDHLSARVI
eukprot:5534409-Amphidinium_carterae.1